ncbi:hypothetical protein [Streptomyces sp. DSM 40750]|uniref:hypothetical protein n=1 Tax=Streptomyces sp. DSM 40750 TaxID=2801030 RepID=UPI00214C5080|nr:hypothetical protein [Streptomyces sp. DSM 40750]UUU25961.1 hypothetical protein JIX55_40230 [Streptomyces sp. DSM 40750]
MSPEDIDYARGVLHVRRQVQAIKGRLYFTLPLGKPEAEGQRKRFSLLLTTRFGNAIAVNTWNTYSWKPALAKAGVIPPRDDGAKDWQ